jgi:hypothetical protein
LWRQSEPINSRNPLRLLAGLLASVLDENRTGTRHAFRITYEAKLHFETPVPFRDNRLRQPTPRFRLWVTRIVQELALARCHLHLELSAFDSGSRPKHRCSAGNVVWHGSDYGLSARKNRNLAHDVQLWVAHRLPVTSLRVST